MQWVRQFALDFGVGILLRPLRAFRGNKSRNKGSKFLVRMLIN